MTPEEAVPLLNDWLSMPGWTEVANPALLRLRDQAILALLNPDPAKKASDDFTKGQINVLSWFIAWPTRTVQLAADLVPAPTAEVEGVGTVLGPNGEPTSPPTP